MCPRRDVGTELSVMVTAILPYRQLGHAIIAAAEWLAAFDHGFATCPITQGSLARFLMHAGQSALTAKGVVNGIEKANRHEFWPDSVSFADVKVGGVVGHRQVTDAYLAQLARRRKGQLATLDSGLAHLHNDVAVLIPTAP